MPSYNQYKRQIAVLDDDNDIESWITVRGNHIPIKKGQSKEDAVKSFIESNGGKTGTPKGEKINAGNVKSDDIVSFGNEKEKYKVRGFTGKGNGSEKLALKELNSGKESHRSIMSGTEIYKHDTKNKRETYTTAEGFEFYKDTNEPVKKGGYTLADKNGNVILQANFVDNTKSYLESVEKSEKNALMEEYNKAKEELNRQENLYMQGKTTSYQVNEARNKEQELKGKIQGRAAKAKEISVEETEKVVENFFTEQTEKNNAKGVAKEHKMLKQQVANIEKVLEENRRKQKSIPANAYTFSKIAALRREEDNLIKKLREAQNELSDFEHYELS